jgi:hypothetical protein
MAPESVSPIRSHYVFSSVTRNSDLWLRSFEVRPIDRGQWATGDFVVGRIVGQRNRLQLCETKTGRLANVFLGDRLVGALGRRAATLEGVGDWRAIDEDGRMDALTSAGLFGRATSLSPFLPDLVSLDYQGHVLHDGRKQRMSDFVKAPAGSEFDMPVILLVGTSMSSGKTSSGQVIIRALNDLGHTVVGAKLTGAARYRDILSFRDAGAAAIFDFVDAGLPSTVCDTSRFRQAMDVLLGHIAASGADVAVIEAGASPLEPYNGTVAMEVLQAHVCFTVLCASDPYAVVGVQQAFGRKFAPDLIAGPAANTDAAVDLVQRLSGLTALNLMDRRNLPALLERLQPALARKRSPDHR